MKHSTRLLIGVFIAGVLFLLGIINPAHIYSPADVLKGHNKTTCKDCHQPFKKVSSASCSSVKCHPGDNIGIKPAIQNIHIKMKDKECYLCHKEHLYMGEKSVKSTGHEAYLKSASCFECHKGEGDKEHKDKYDVDCARCHNVKDWKKIRFDHALTDKACVSCHRIPKDGPHVDIDGSCRKCHGTKAWKPSTYGHQKDFLLDSDHNVKCKKCHDTGVFKKYTCVNCHEHSGRKIEREHAEEGIVNYGDCLRCHMVTIEGKSYGIPKVDEGFGQEHGRKKHGDKGHKYDGD
ncbi:MAG: hypothetical protein HQL01_13915 [Nitrospirae bacterium]|nr:hypothetical protein [Nitrospirota bacterium]